MRKAFNIGDRYFEVIYVDFPLKNYLEYLK